MITGSAGADSIALLAGDDWVEGMGGADTIGGSFGADTFVYRSASHSNSTTMDRITDFNPVSQGDRIALTAMPSKLWNAGSVSGTVAVTVMANALSAAPADARGAGSAVMVTMGTTATYPKISDGISGLGAGDIVIRMNVLPSSTSGNPFNSPGCINVSSVFSTI